MVGRWLKDFIDGVEEEAPDDGQTAVGALGELNEVIDKDVGVGKGLLKLQLGAVSGPAWQGGHALAGRDGGRINRARAWARWGAKRLRGGLRWLAGVGWVC